MRKSNRRKRRKAKKRICLIFVFCICLIVGRQFLHSGKTNASNDIATYKYASEENGWNLILINSENLIPKDYEVDLIQLSNGEQVDTRMYPALQEMFDAARLEGYGLFVRDGYRTQEEQQKIFDEKVLAYMRDGNSKSEARINAMKWVAVPGTSEHQTGLAVDINADININASLEVYNWLSKNAYKYGFIKRYTEDKTDLTGVMDEPWHYRFVGKDAAWEIYSQGLCLEEYIQALSQ